MALHPLVAPGLHLVPLFLLGRVKRRADLRVGVFPNIHHFAVPVLLGERAVLVQGLHLRLLIGGEIELFGEMLGALCGIGRTMVPATVAFRGWSLLIIGRRWR